MSVKLGEVWQDGEGTLMVALSPSEDGRDTDWAVFLNDRPVKGDNPLIVYPLSLVFDDTGKAHADHLRYPDGTAFRG